MIKSMTGFGRGESVSEDCKVTVEIKAVNHRYCDLNMKLPRKLNYLEADIRNFLKQSIQRGKVDVFINYEDLSAKDVNVRLNEELGREYYAALTRLGETLGISSEVTALQIGRFADVLTLEDVPVNQDSIKEQIMEALKEATNKCKPVLLAPIMKVEVVVPEEYMGNVMGDLTSRRGKPLGNESRGNALSINAMVPLAEMFGYATSLRSNSQGRGNFTMTLDHYEEVPKNIAEEIIKKNSIN